MLDRLLSDLRYAARTLAKSPGWCAGVVLILALGIGATTAIFGLVDAVLFRPLPFPHPDELVRVFATDAERGGLFSASYPAYTDYRDQAKSLSGLAAFAGSNPVHLVPPAPSTAASTARAGAEPLRVDAMLVSGSFFPLLGARPALGRLIEPGDDAAPGGGPVVVLTDRLWRRLGADPGVVGAAVRVNGHPMTVVGVAPSGFTGPSLDEAADLWLPMSMAAEALPSFASLNIHTARNFYWLQMVGRLAPGVAPAAAQAELDAIASRRAAAEPKGRREPGARVVGARAALFDPDSRGPLDRLAWTLFALVGLVLLLASAVAAGLLLVRGERRRREVALRLAVGASRLRLVRELALESLMLAALAGALAVCLAAWLSDLLAAILPASFPIPPHAAEPAFAGRVVAFSALAALLSAALFGLVPALGAAATDPLPALKSETPPPGARRARLPLKSAFAVLQVALATVLLVGAGLLVRTLLATRAVDPGFDPERGLVVSLDLARQGYDPPATALFYDRLLARLDGAPGVRSVALARTVPVQAQGLRVTVKPEGYAFAAGEDEDVGLDVVTPSYFATLGVPLAAGRGLAAADGRDDAPVALVNQAFARRFWPGESPLGKHLADVGPKSARLEIVGVVRDHRTHSLRQPAEPTLYLPLAQLPAYGMSPLVSGLTLLVRTPGDPYAALPAVRGAVSGLDPELPLFGVQSLSEHLGATLAMERTVAGLVSALGLLALVLAAGGLFSVVAYSTEARTRELGIRMALGADRGGVLALVLRQGLGLAAAGLGLGFVAALLAGLAARHAVAGLLFGVRPHDPATFAAIGLLLAVTALAAAWLPAQRATRVDPAVALRHD